MIFEELLLILLELQQQLMELVDFEFVHLLFLPLVFGFGFLPLSIFSIFW
ncbi:MAG: hypothetical protein CH104c_0758 [Candidatus Woesebacteria bacterium]|nr:MAG: hypothetical protein CH104c_0758 [Candidatus Woesebacteria bacterium]